MPWDYAEDADFAHEEILDAGQTATLIKKVSSGPENAPTITDDPHEIVCLDLDQAQVVAVGGGVAVRHTRTLLVSTKNASGVALAVAPEQDDRVTIGGKTQPVVDVRTLSPGGTVVLWEVDLG